MDRAAVALSATTLAALLSAAATGATPTPVKPAGSPGTWVTSDDYPVSALRAGVGGSTGFRLDINAQGNVSRCTVTRASGTAALDTAACTLLSARGQFIPATDRNGNAIASAYTSTVRWQIPNDGGAAMMRSHFESCIMQSRDMIVVETAFGCAF
jgi:TonB family protein